MMDDRLLMFKDDLVQCVYVIVRKCNWYSHIFRGGEQDPPSLSSEVQSTRQAQLGTCTRINRNDMGSFDQGDPPLLRQLRKIGAE